MNRHTFLASFGHLADAPGGVDALRRIVLGLAIRGRLTDMGPDAPGSIEVRHPDTPLPSLPVGWTTSTLSDIAEVRLGRQRSPKNHGGDQMRKYIRAANVTWSGLDLSDVMEMNFTDAEMETYRLKAGDLVLSEASGSPSGVGKPALWNDDLPECAFQNTLIRVRPFAANPRYLLVYFRAQVLLGRFVPEARGVGINHLGRSRLARWQVPVPPEEEQVLIVERVDELMALCDELEEQQAARTDARSALSAATLNRVSAAETAEDLRSAVSSFTERIDLHLAPGDGDLAALKRLRQTILDLAVQGRLTSRDLDDEPAAELLDQITGERDRLVKAKEIRRPKKFEEVVDRNADADLPRGWAWARANEFFIASDSGWSPQCLVESAGPGEWGVLKTSAVSRGVFDQQESKKLPATLEPRTQLEVLPGEFVMIRASGSKSLVGRGAIVTETESRLMLSDKHIRLSFLHEASTRFWAILNDSTAVQSYYTAESSGTSTMSNVTRDRIGSLVVAVPPLAEQLRIVEGVDQLLGLCDDLEEQFHSARSLRGDLAASVAAHVVPVVPGEAA